MKYVFIILVVILFLFVLSLWNEKQLAKKRKAQLKKEWGQIPEEEYTSEKFDSLKEFYRSIQEDRYDVDDITWNDLDMDDIYMLMNNTQSSIGEEYLYALLRKPCLSKTELEERNRLIHFFHHKEEQRIALQTAIKSVGKLQQISVYQYINRLDEQKSQSNLPHYFMAFGLLLSLGLIFVNPAYGGICTLIFAVNNIIQYYKRKAEIDKYLTVVAYILRLLDSIGDIEKLNIEEISQYTDTLRKDKAVFKPFIRGAAILTSRSVSGNLLDTFVDYVRMLFHLDLIKFNSMITIFKKKREVLNRIFINVGLLDSMVAVASFREMLPYYCEPELTKGGRPFLSVTDLYHPLLSNPVPNSISETDSVLITGSNASGKSTFIKTMAINAILSQTIFTSISRKYRASYFIVFSSMALRDNIFSNESYYIVEIKSLKRILDHINPEIPILCFIDEVLRGTNTLERIAASSRILASLAQKNALVFAATHDIELTHILEEHYRNYHFQERIADNQILFDYQLHSGRAVSKNAIKLLGVLGYSRKIIDEAEQAAEEFMRVGEWSKIQ
jgi:DNA mismatch repair ATPase MutS